MISHGRVLVCPACPACGAGLSGGPVVWWCSAGHTVYAADLNQEATR